MIIGLDIGISATKVVAFVAKKYSLSQDSTSKIITTNQIMKANYIVMLLAMTLSLMGCRPATNVEGNNVP